MSPSVRWRGDAVEAGAAEHQLAPRGGRSISSAFINRNWLAANSIASGRPSSRRQISKACSVDTSGGSAVRRARSAKSRIAVGLGQRLERTHELAVDTEGATARREHAGVAAPSTITVVTGDRLDEVFAVVEDDERRRHGGRVRRSRPSGRRARDAVSKPTAVAMLSATRSASSMPARSTIHTPPGNRSVTSWPTCCARRVLPMPPGPVIVTSRLSLIAWATASSSSARPTNDLSSSACCRRVGRWSAARRRARIVTQDRLFELAQFGGRLDPDLVGEVPSMPLEHPKCLDLTPTPIQRQHQERRQALAQRVRVDEFGELADRGPVMTAVELRLEPRFNGEQAQLVESRPLRRNERQVGEIGEHVTAPQREPAVEVTGCDQPLEPSAIEPVGLDVEQIARPTVRSTSAGRILRSSETYFWSVLPAVAGG